MIPPLDDKVLPEGIHRCTLEECEAAFGGFLRSDRRPRLTEALRRYIADARSAGIAIAILVDGNFVTAKAEPSDIDLILVLKPDFDFTAEMRPMEYNVQSKRAVRKLYGLDVLPAVEGSDAYQEYVGLFSQIRRDDPGTTKCAASKGTAEDRAMIQDDDQLSETRVAIAHLESAVASLKREVLPINPARFALMAEPAVDQIRVLRAQVEEYVGVTSAVSQEAESNLRKPKTLAEVTSLLI